MSSTPPTNPAPNSIPAIDLPYGAPIGLEQARSVLAAAQAEAAKNKWNVAVAVVDAGGHLMVFERMDLAPFASAEVAIAKARTAAGFRRPSKAFHDMVAAGGEGLRMLGLPGAVPIEGGVPIASGGKVIGAVGVSGVTSSQDGQIARAGSAIMQ